MTPVKKIKLEYVRKTKIKYFSKVNYKISETSTKFQLVLGFFCSIWNKPRVRDGTASRSSNPIAEPALSRISIQPLNAVICQSYKGHVLEEHQTTFQGIVSCLIHLICHSIALWVWVRHSSRKPFNHGVDLKVSKLLSHSDFQGIICYFTPENYDNIMQAVLNATFPH